MDVHTRVAATYTQAADTLDSLPFWHHFGRRTVERLALAPGARVLDLCCGSGASALPAADAVGPAGSVLGVDLTEALVAQARRKAAAQGLRHAAFRCAPVESLTFPPDSFDAVISVFGLFFIEDMAGLLARAWEWLAPGGVLAITTWGEEVLAPGEAVFWDAVRAEHPSIETASHAARLDTPEKLARVFEHAGIAPVDIARDSWEMPLASPEAFWPVIMGTSSRAAYEALPPDGRTRVRTRVTDALRGLRVTRMEVLYALARRG
ncbi:MAG: methyltransferase domain-containing protein [Acidobacteria bacterium]|nr:methyltransferase domain-containing protein [Acidobacteriota bacterium]